jgi:hypothetical protein
MFTDAVTLMDQTIESLETLAVVFADEIDERMRGPGASPRNAFLYRTAHIKIAELLPALRAARITQQAQTAALYRTQCVNCD